jgi:adenylate cyclase
MHTAASRVHATVECKQGKYVLEDVSTNGTYVIKDGQPFVFVHRDSVTLDGSGILATGFLPKDEDDSHGAIRFVTRQAED